jgi:hypothetical protein
VFRKISGLKADEMSGQLRISYSGKIRDLYRSLGIVRTVNGRKLR